MKISWKRGSIAILLCAMLGYILYVYYGTSSTNSGTIYVGSPITIKTGNITNILSFDGTTEFASTQKLTFGQEGKKVTHVFVKVGNKVRQDQVLATLESSEVDSSFKSAKSSLAIAQLNYDKAVANVDKEYELLKAKNNLQSAESSLNNIQSTITVANNDEDNAIKKAEQTIKDAQKDYDDLYNESISAQSDTTRTKRNTYTTAIDNLRDIVNSVQTNLDSIDKIMYFTDKFKNGSDRASIYLGAKDINAVSSATTAFFDTHKDLQLVQSDYTTIFARDVDRVTIKELEQAYAHVTAVSKGVMNIGNYSRTMFEASVISSDSLTQNTLDSYITLANTIYTNGRSIKDKATATMESIYKLDDSLDLVKAKQAIDDAKLALDKLLLSKQNRESSNTSKRVAAEIAVKDAQKTIANIHNGYSDTTVQNAYNQLIQAQSSLESVLKKYENYQLIANFNGTVTEMNVQVGDTLTTSNMSDTYIYVENPNLIEISLDVEQTDILKLSLGNKASIVLDVFPSLTLSGVISQISTVPVTNNGVSTYTVKVLFEKPVDKKILGGMTATVNFTISQKKNVVLVPNSALTSSNGEYYVTMEDGTQHAVQIGESDDTNTEIVSGLVSGDVILGMKISASDLTNAGVSSTTQDSGMPGGSTSRSTTTQGGSQEGRPPL